MPTAEEKARRAIKELSPGDSLAPLGNLWMSIEKRIIKEIRKAEADGFKRWRQEGLEEAAAKVRLEAERHDDQLGFSRATEQLIRALHVAEGAIRDLMEKPDAE